MKAIISKALSDDYSQLELIDRDKPEPGPGQVRVRMLMAPINPSDSNFIHGDYYNALARLIWNQGQQRPFFDPARQQIYPQLPYVLGGEGVGIVEACGSGLLARRLAGKRVAIAAGPPEGSWQEYTVVDAKKAIPVGDHLNDEQAAMFTINPLSAYAIVRKVLQARKGQWLLQSGAASALGQMVIRMAAEYGYRTINIIRNPAQKAQLLNLGADEVIVLGEDNEGNEGNIVEQVAQISGGRGVDNAMDCIGGELAGDMARCLGVGGKLVLYGTLGGRDMVLPARDLMMPGAKVEGFFAGSWLARQSTITLLSCIRQLNKLSQKGFFHTDVVKTYPMAEFAQALNAANSSAKGGKILLRIGE
ncbi:MAG: zinc-dependent alcohol dehydrogenase family protein [Cellvibrionaceae bacterium]|nr:zinc-dependent alcohol dehydrogenase family protein [Cellvibrionaceae bacterium]